MKLFCHPLRIVQSLQGSNLEKSFVYYGGYTYTRAEQEGWYRVDYMYGVMIAATFLFSFLCVLIRYCFLNVSILLDACSPNSERWSPFLHQKLERVSNLAKFTPHYFFLIVNIAF